VRVGEQAQELRDGLGISIGGALDYPSDVASGPSREAADLFADDVVGDLEQRNQIVADSVASDAAALDVLRGLDSRPAVVGEPGTSRGMVYWYYVLAGRLDDTVAWNAAVGWNGDETVFRTGSEGNCVSATIATVDETSQARLVGALQQWAAAGPAASAASVTPSGTDRIDVHSCDPGPDADTKKDGGIQFWGFGDVELHLIDGLALVDADARTCVVNALRNFDVLGQVIGSGDAGSGQAAVDAILQTCTSG
jgi:hypothetical protein